MRILVTIHGSYNMYKNCDVIMKWFVVEELDFTDGYWIHLTKTSEQSHKYDIKVSAENHIVQWSTPRNSPSPSSFTSRNKYYPPLPWADNNESGV